VGFGSALGSGSESEPGSGLGFGFGTSPNKRPMQLMLISFVVFSAGRVANIVNETATKSSDKGCLGTKTSAPNTRLNICVYIYCKKLLTRARKGGKKGKRPEKQKTPHRASWEITSLSASIEIIKCQNGAQSHGVWVEI